jgi:hypothetical protein
MSDDIPEHPNLPDSEQEQEQEQEQEELEEQAQAHVYDQPLIVHNQWSISPEYALYALVTFNFLWTVTKSVTEFTYTVGKSVWKTLQPDTYYFFQGYDAAYKASDYTRSGPGVPPVEWLYDSKKKTFMNPMGSQRSHHLPWLSAEIKHMNLTLYDITEFVESIRYFHDEGSSATWVPSAEHVLSAWSLESGILLDKSGSLVLSVIDENGDGEEIPLYQRVQ